MSHEYVLEKAKAGDIEAFGALYDLSVDRVYAFVFHRTMDDRETEDIVSLVFMKAFKSIGRFRGCSMGEYFSWVFRIAYTTFLDCHRLLDETLSIDEMEEIFGYETDRAKDIDEKTKLKEILQYMDTLSERERMILTMRIWDDLSYAEIASITGETVDNAKKIVSRTLAKIQANIPALLIFGFILPYVI